MALPSSVSLPAIFEPYTFRGSSLPPALSSGLVVFLVFIFIICNISSSFENALVLKSSALTGFELNRLSFYPIIHLGIIHLLFNLVALIPLVRKFENVNGTIRTGIVLNVLAVVPGIAYCLLGLLFFPTSAVAGASGWVFSFLGYFAYYDFKRNPVWQITPAHAIPTWSVPLIPLIITAIIMPGSSFLGHLLGLLAGWAMGLGYLDPLIEPSTNVVEWIEVKLARVIGLIPRQFYFVGEVNARELRLLSKSDGLPVTENNPSAPAVAGGSNQFSGQGHVLGQ